MSENGKAVGAVWEVILGTLVHVCFIFLVKYTIKYETGEPLVPEIIVLVSIVIVLCPSTQAPLLLCRMSTHSEDFSKTIILAVFQKSFSREFTSADFCNLNNTPLHLHAVDQPPSAQPNKGGGSTNSR